VFLADALPVPSNALRCLHSCPLADTGVAAAGSSALKPMYDIITLVRAASAVRIHSEISGVHDYDFKSGGKDDRRIRIFGHHDVFAAS